MDDYDDEDPLAEKFLEYLKDRNYIEGDVILKPDLNVSIEESIELDTVEKDASRIYGASCTSGYYDLLITEKQFVILKNWIADLEEEHVQNELSPLLMPLLFHLYLDSLRRTPRLRSVKFLKRHYGPLLTEEWAPLLEQLLKLRSGAEVPYNELITEFRDSKVDVKVTPRSLALLRKCLSSNNLNVLIPNFQSWFEISVTTDDVLSSEEDISSPDFPAMDEEGEIEDPDHVAVNDEEMEELLMEIQNKREQPTPPPPLLLYTAHRTEGIVCGRISEERKFAATGGQNSEVRVWGLSEAKMTPQLDPSYFASVPLAAFTEPLTDPIPNKKQMWSLRGHCDTVYDLAFLTDSEYVVSVSFDTTMRLWKLSDFSCGAVYRGHSSPIWGIAVSPIANYVATASHDKTARLWCLDRTFPVRIFAGHHQDVTCVAFHPNGSYLATGSPDKTLRIWSATDGSMVRVMGCQRGHGAVGAVAFSPNGQYVASAGDDKLVCLWDLASGSLICRLGGHTSRIISVAWSKDGSTVSASGFDGTVLLWSLDNQSQDVIEPKRYITKCTTLLSLEYSPKNVLVGVGLA